MHKPNKKNDTPKNKKRVRSRNFCFTDFELMDLGKIYHENFSIIRYLCWGKEICPTTKKAHYQGWLQMINPKDFNVIRKLLGGKCHLERCLGSEYNNDKYCKKNNDFVSFGTFKSQGFRSDMEDIKKTLDEGGSIKMVADAHFTDYIRYYSGIEKYQQMVQKDATKDFRQVDTTVHFGPTGTGKTRTAVEASGDHYMIRGDDLTWFDGYMGETTLIIDEYANQVPITRLLSLLDGYQLRLPVKGGFTYANWTTVYITTNLDTLHPNAKDEHREALERRVTTVKQFSHEVLEG